MAWVSQNVVWQASHTGSPPSQMLISSQGHMAGERGVAEV